MGIGLCLSLGVCLGLRCKVLRLCLGFRLSMCMYMGLSLQVLSLCLCLQALSVRGETLSLGSSLQVCRLRYGLVALHLQIFCMSLQSKWATESAYAKGKLGRTMIFWRFISKGIVPLLLLSQLDALLHAC